MLSTKNGAIREKEHCTHASEIGQFFFETATFHPCFIGFGPKHFFKGRP